MDSDGDIVHDFLVEGGEILERLDAQLVDLEASTQDCDLLNTVFRAFHTIKGGAGFLGLEHLVAVSHKSEDLFDLLSHGDVAMDAELMDIFLQTLDVLRGMFDNEAVSQTGASLDVVTSDLQMALIKTRMQPMSKVFGRFPRVVRDLARQLGKDVRFEIAGEDTDLDKNLVEALADPLVHLVRNAVDHGIEMPDDRLAAGKSRTGHLRLAAEQAGDQIQLVISDDGKGIDVEALRRKVVEKDLLGADAAARLTERECFELIFLPGFSTKDAITDFSGRGVGMDVVKTRITQLNGTIEIDSRLGLGTTIRVSLPLTLAIMPTLMVMLGQQVFVLPLVYLSRWLVQGCCEFNEPSGHVVLARVGSQSVGLRVNDLIGREEVVIKQLGALLHGTRGVSRATITGHGKIALNLDLPSLLDAHADR